MIILAFVSSPIFHGVIIGTHWNLYWLMLSLFLIIED